MGFSSDFKFNGDFKNMDPKKIKQAVREIKPRVPLAAV